MYKLITKASKFLKSGHLVAIPTETVYGLGADASNPKAVKKIFKAKGRPADHPVIVHIYSENQLKDWVQSIPATAKKLMQSFWPGPLTLIFKAKRNVSPLITGNQKTIGIRMPSHPIARKLLKEFGGAIAAPSANRFGKISPTKASHVKEELGDSVSLILDGGDCVLGIESTIIDVTHSPPRLLRPGPLDIERVKKISGVKVVHPKKSKIRVSGSLPSHYAPTTPLYLCCLNNIGRFVIPVMDGRDPVPGKAKTSMFLDPGQSLDGMTASSIAIVSFRPKTRKFKGIWIKMPLNPILYAHKLYATLRKLDTKNLSGICVEMPPEEVVWEAIRDRLNRAKCIQPLILKNSIMSAHFLNDEVERKNVYIFGNCKKNAINPHRD